jgi:TIR domain/YARHG domain
MNAREGLPKTGDKLRKIMAEGGAKQPQDVLYCRTIECPAEAAMAEIFISYAKDDRADAGQLAAFLKEQGHSVWWDRELVGGQQFATVIAQALARSKVTIVIWTLSSIDSDWVIDEADTARKAKKLIPVRADDLDVEQIPLSFRRLHTVQLSDRDGLVNAIQTYYEAPLVKPSRWTVLKMRVVRRVSGARRRVTLGNIAVAAIALPLLAYYCFLGVDWYAIRDSMEPNDFQQRLKYPFSPYAAKARAKLGGIDAWEHVKESRNVADLQRFVEAYPGSIYYQFAVLRVTRLQAVASPQYQSTLPDSSRRILTPEELSSLGCGQLWKARNEIFYSLGYCFVTDDGIDSFGTRAECPYHNCGTIDQFNSMTKDILTKIEIGNVNTILGVEQKLKCRLPKVTVCRPL